LVEELEGRFTRRRLAAKHPAKATAVKIGAAAGEANGAETCAFLKVLGARGSVTGGTKADVKLSEDMNISLPNSAANSSTGAKVATRARMLRGLRMSPTLSRAPKGRVLDFKGPLSQDGCI